MSQALDFEENISEAVSIEEIADDILDSMEESRFGSDIILVIADLPPIRIVAPEDMAQALALVLGRYYIKIPADIYSQIEKGDFSELTFFAPAREEKLRPRTVIINTSPQVRTLMIQGEAPEDGIEGDLELFFDFSPKPGKIFPDGTIDFRCINKFPQAKKGERLARIYEPTPGLPGTDVNGLPIKPEPGPPFPVELGEGLLLKQDFDKERNRHCQDVFAKDNGIIITRFAEGTREATNLRALSVQNKLVVRDIDFTTGNLGDGNNEFRCSADVVVNGDIRGNFSAIIDGNLEVRGAVEGQHIDVTESVQASFIRTSVRAGKNIEVGAARGAHLESAQDIIVSREIQQCRIHADSVIMEPSGTSQIFVGHLYIKANQVHMASVDLRNHIDIELGQELFDAKYRLEKRKKELEALTNTSTNTIKDQVISIGERLKDIQHSADNKGIQSIIALRHFLAAILKGTIKAEKAHRSLADWMKEAPNYLHSTGRRASKVVILKEEQEDLALELQKVNEEHQKIMERLGKIMIKIRGSLAPSAILHLRCGEFERKWNNGTADSTTPINIELAFDPARGLIETI